MPSSVCPILFRGIVKDGSVREYRAVSPFELGGSAPFVRRLFWEWQEAKVTGILDKFHVEHGTHGARVMARSHSLTNDCTADGEIDSAIQMLKDDLDACAKEMKRLVAINQRGSVFEGWPSVKDPIVHT